MHTSPNRYRLRAFLFLTAGALAVTSVHAQTTTANLLTNPGAEQGTGNDPGIVTGWTAGGTTNPGRDDGTLDGIAPYAGTYAFFGGTGGSGSNGTLTQRVDLVGAGLTVALINTPGTTATFSFFERSLNDGGTPNVGDAAGVNLFFLNAAGTQIGTATNGPFYSPGQWTFETATAAVPAGTRYVDFQMTFLKRIGVDSDGYIDNASLTVSVVPEPSTWALLLGAVGIVALALRRKTLATSGKVNFTSR